MIVGLDLRAHASPFSGCAIEGSVGRKNRDVDLGRVFDGAMPRGLNQTHRRVALGRTGGSDAGCRGRERKIDALLLDARR